jgi:hypothetical protein
VRYAQRVVKCAGQSCRICRERPPVPRGRRCHGRGEASATTGLLWRWSITEIVPAVPNVTNGHAATLDEAKAKFRAAWEKTKAGALPQRPLRHTFPKCGNRGHGCPVVAAAGEQANANRIATRHQPIAVMLNLVDPIGTGRRLVGGGWKAGFDKAGRSTLQHAAS